MHNVAHVLSACLPTVVGFACYRIYQRRLLAAAGVQSSIAREICLTMFAAVLSAVFALKLWPVYVWEPSPGMWGDLRLLVERPSWDSMLDLIPFHSFVNDYHYVQLGSSDFMTVLANIGWNILAFLPIGFFPALLFRKRSLGISCGIGCVLSLATEVGQYFLMRSAATDDVVLNTLGAACGYGLFAIANRTVPDFVKYFTCEVNGEY